MENYRVYAIAMLDLLGVKGFRAMQKRAQGSLAAGSPCRLSFGALVQLYWLSWLLKEGWRPKPL